MTGSSGSSRGLRVVALAKSLWPTASRPEPMTRRDAGAEAASLGAEPAGPAQDPADGAEPQIEEPRSHAGLVTRGIAMALDARLIDGVALAVTGAVLLVNSVFSISNRHHDLAVVIGGALFILWVVCYFGA